MSDHAVQGYHFRYSGIPGQIFEAPTAFQPPNSLVLHTNKGLQLLNFHLNSGCLAGAPAAVSRATEALRLGTLTSASAFTGPFEFVVDGHSRSSHADQTGAATSHSLASSAAAPEEQRQANANSAAPCSPADQRSNASDLATSPSAHALVCTCQVPGTATVQGQQPSPACMLCCQAGTAGQQQPCQEPGPHTEPRQLSPGHPQLCCPDLGMRCPQDADKPLLARPKAAEPSDGIEQIPDAAPETSATHAQGLSHEGQNSVDSVQGLSSTSSSPEAPPVTRQGRSVWSMSSSDSTDQAPRDQGSVPSAQASPDVYETLLQHPDTGADNCVLHNACVFGHEIAQWVQPGFGGLTLQVAGPLFDPERFIIDVLPHSVWRQMALIDYAMQTVHLTTSQTLLEGQCCSSMAEHQAVIVVAAILQDKIHMPRLDPKTRAAVVTGILHFTSGAIHTQSGSQGKHDGFCISNLQLYCTLLVCQLKAAKISKNSQ